MLDKKRLGTFILGGLTGVLAGILLAPKSGRETRGDLANRAGEAGQRSRESYFDTGERLKERLSATRDRSYFRQPAPPEHEMPVGMPVEPARETPPNSAEPEPHPGVSDISEERLEREMREARANLRDVSSGEGNDARSEELRRKVRETRERIKSRMEREGTSGEENEPDGDEV